MDQTDWLNALAMEMNGYYDEDEDVLVVEGDFGATTYSFSEILQLYRTNVSPKEAADILRMGGTP